MLFIKYLISNISVTYKQKNTRVFAVLERVKSLTPTKLIDIAIKDITNTAFVLFSSNYLLQDKK